MDSNDGIDRRRHVHKVIGYEIDFPFQPYGIQRAMISRLSAALTNKDNFLLESPTGTGKTLVLLCTTLAWQKKSKEICQPLMSKKLREEKARERLARLMSRPCSCGRRENSGDDDLKKEKDDLKKGKGEGCKESSDDFQSNKRMKTEDTSEYKTSRYFSSDEDNEPKKPKSNLKEPEYVIIIDSDDEDVNQASKVKKEVESVTNGCKIHSDKQETFDSPAPMCRSCEAIETEKKFADVIGDSAHDGEGIISSKVKAKIPRIYYGTRTHKQITQVIRELNKTSYNSELKMCILSARERACINSEVRDLPNRNDRCKELIKNKPDNSSMSKSRAKNLECCPYYTDSNYISSEFENINEEFKTSAWDIEDACNFGMNHRVCPYYGIRALQEQADITFCPYNYLLDPNIRRAMNVNLNNAVVVFDEAHNIEDICRDSASFIIDTAQIDEIIESIRGIASFYIQGSVIMDAYQFFKDKLQNLSLRLRNFPFDSGNDERGEYLKKKVLMNTYLVEFMSELDLGPENLPAIKENLKALRGDDEENGDKSSKSSVDDAKLNNAQMQFIDQLCITLEFMYANSNKNLQDFRLVITEALDRGPPKRNSFGTSSDNFSGPDRHIWKLHLLCMNPGITFEKIHSQAWSVIVASGTLSPTESLKSELGCKFTDVFEGAHVIKSDRIFASILSHGPTKRVELKCSYQESLKLEFQDEVGKIIRDVCLQVPNGILCFFPSYDRLENFYQRWHTTKIMSQILSKKKFFRERRNQTASKFEEELSKFNTHANAKGALLFAVFRGKVSEGIDFADKAARAVVTIGIPYPSVMDLNVGLKKQYNDIMRPTRPYLMTGDDWYSAQAFRALNQALGRCIRHKDDWGAILMIDSRLNYGSNSKNISKWLRQVLCQSQDYSVLCSKLGDFVEKKKDEENSESYQR